jgi:hypothetical protein
MPQEWVRGSGIRSGDARHVLRRVRRPLGQVGSPLEQVAHISVVVCGCAGCLAQLMVRNRDQADYLGACRGPERPQTFGAGPPRERLGLPGAEHRNPGSVVLTCVPRDNRHSMLQRRRRDEQIGL